METGRRKKEEIFVNVIENISVTFSSNGHILTSEIEGTIQTKSCLSGDREIRIALNDDLTIGVPAKSTHESSSSFGRGNVVLDECNFHESVRHDSFDTDRTLSLIPPDEEFSVMKYRVIQEFKPPFRINAVVQELGSSKFSAMAAEVTIKIRAEFPSSISANKVLVEMPLPSYTTRASFELEAGTVGNTTDFKESNKQLEWGLEKVVGGSEHSLCTKLKFSQESQDNISKEAGPIRMTFTIPMYNASRLQVKYVHIAKKAESSNPYVWVRYLTQANSYVAHL